MEKMKVLKKILLDNMVLDGIEFYEALCFKMNSVKVTFNALKNIEKEQTEKMQEGRNKLFEIVLKGEKAYYVPEEDVVDYFGIKVSRDMLIDKLTVEIFGTVHGFFDVLAQMLNTVLYGDKKSDIWKVNIKKTIARLEQFEQYQGEYIDAIKNICETDEYKFIDDFNNIVKHRGNIFPKMKFDILKGKKDLYLPPFEKQDRNQYKYHERKGLIDEVDKCIAYCDKTFKQTCEFIIEYFSNNKHQHVGSRRYNPSTYIAFKDKSDFERFTNPINSMHCIKLEKGEVVLDEYKIMLIHEDIETKKIEAYNCPYEKIILKDNNDEIVGLLIAKDNKVFDMKDGRGLVYREYAVQKEDYIVDCYEYITNGKIKFLPYLSSHWEVFYGVKEE